MKQIVIVMMLLCGCIANAQIICLRAGKTVSPSDYLSLRYTHPSNSDFQFSLSSFFESSRFNHLHFSSVGFDAMAELKSKQSDLLHRKVEFTSAIGIGWLIEHEPWLYKDWSFAKRSSLGLSSEVNGYWHLSDIFSLNGFLQQKILFNPLLGRYRFIAGIGLCYRIG